MSVRITPEFCNTCHVFKEQAVSFLTSGIDPELLPDSICPKLGYMVLQKFTQTRMLEIADGKNLKDILSVANLRKSPELRVFQISTEGNANYLVKRAEKCANLVKAGDLGMIESVDTHKLLEDEVFVSLQSFECGLNNLSS